MTLATAVTFNVENGGADPDLLVSGQLVGGGTVTKNGAGTMVLSNAANSNTGTTYVNAGTLRLGASEVIANNADLANNWAGGGTVDLNGYSETIRRLGGNPAIANSGGGTPTLTVGANNGSGWNYGGLISGNVAIRKIGTGWQQLSGNNTYSGGTIVDAGELRLSGPNDPTSSVGLGDLVINPNGTVRALSHNVLGHTAKANIPNVVINGGALIPNQYLHVADIDMTGGVIEAGPAGGSGLQTHTTVFTSHAAASTALIHARVNAFDGTVTFNVADGAPDPDLHVSGQIHGGNSIHKIGPGTLMLSGNNTYGGSTIVQGGVLKLGASNVIPDSSEVNNFWVGTGTLDLNGFDEGVRRLGGNFAITNTGPGTPTLSIGTNNGSLWDYGGVISGDMAVRKVGNGWQGLNNSGSNYTGGTIVDGGELRLSGSNNGQSTVGVGNVVINPGATIRARSHNVFGHTTGANIPHVHINGGTLIPYQYLHVDTVEMTGGVIEAGPAGGSGLQTHASVFTGNAAPTAAFIHARVQAAMGDITFDIADGAADPDMHVTAQIYGGNGFSKTGAGTLLLSGNNTYSGATAVNGGTLLLDGTHTGGGAYTVAGGATLGGTGSTASAVTVQPGGILAPDGSLGTGSLDLEALSFLEIGFDALTVFDSVTLDGTVNVSGAELQVLLGYAPSNGDYFVIVDNDGTADAVTGNFLGLPEHGRLDPLFGGEPYGFWITYQGGDGNDIALLAVPEPTTLSLLGLGALAALVRRRRRRA